MIVSEGLSLLITTNILYLLCVSSFFLCISIVDTFFFEYLPVFVMSYRRAVCFWTRGQWFHGRWDTEETIQNCLKGNCRERVLFWSVWTALGQVIGRVFLNVNFVAVVAAPTKMSEVDCLLSPFNGITSVHLWCCWFCLFSLPTFKALMTAGKEPFPTIYVDSQKENEVL